MAPEQPDPVAMALLEKRLRVAIPAVLVPMTVWSALAGFFGLWPGHEVEAALFDTLGFATMRGVIVGTFVAIGLAVLAGLLPLVILVNVVRKLRG